MLGRRRVGARATAGLVRSESAASRCWCSTRAAPTRPAPIRSGALAIVLASLSWAVGSLWSVRADAARSRARSRFGAQMICGGLAALSRSAPLGGRVGVDRSRRSPRRARSRRSLSRHLRLDRRLLAPTAICCARRGRSWRRPTPSSTRSSRSCSAGCSPASRSAGGSWSPRADPRRGGAADLRDELRGRACAPLGRARESRRALGAGATLRAGDRGAARPSAAPAERGATQSTEPVDCSVESFARARGRRAARSADRARRRAHRAAGGA